MCSPLTNSCFVFSRILWPNGELLKGTNVELRQFTLDLFSWVNFIRILILPWDSSPSPWPFVEYLLELFSNHPTVANLSKNSSRNSSSTTSYGFVVWGKLQCHLKIGPGAHRCFGTSVVSLDVAAGMVDPLVKTHIRLLSIYPPWN